MRDKDKNKGSVLVIVMIVVLLLTITGFGILRSAFGSRLQAVQLKNEAVATLSAEAAYEQAVFWMSQQPDMLAALSQGVSGTTGNLTFLNSNSEYQVSFAKFLASMPIYRVHAKGTCGSSERAVDAYLIQNISGWESPHRVPSGSGSSAPWPFSSSETIDIPIHVNSHGAPDDTDRDLYTVDGGPTFTRRVSLGEGRYSSGGSDKYSDLMDNFNGGVYFNQPDNKISQVKVVQAKADRFRDSTLSTFRFTPTTTAPLTNPNVAVQLEFFVEGGVGKVRITNNCGVRGYQDTRTSGNRTYDYIIDDPNTPDSYKRYDIYSYHVRPTSESPTTYNLTDTYVQQDYGGYQSDPGGQIYVDGNVIIGGDDSRHDNNQLLAGKITVVASGNIWVADSITVDGSRDGDMPAPDNTNVLGLVAQGVVKVVDPGMASYSYIDGGSPLNNGSFQYIPIGQPYSSYRTLPSNMIVEAAITVGGGGWGAEHVGERRMTSPTSFGYHKLIVRGAIIEAMRGIVGTDPSKLSFPDSSNGYLKHYYFDNRLPGGLLPGNIWLKAKYTPLPGGWSDYRVATVDS